MQYINNFPIFIPIKGVSKRCPGKNAILLRLLTKVFKTYKYDEEYSNILDKCIIITESDALIEEAKEVGDNKIEKEKAFNPSEFHAINRCIEEYNNGDVSFNTNFDMSYFFLAPVTQPFKSENFICHIENIIAQINDYVDINPELSDRDVEECYYNNIGNFITTVSTQQDRSLFEYDLANGKFVNDSKMRKGCLCDNKCYIDGHWYFIKSEFISNLIWSINNFDKYNNTDINELFWSSKFNVMENNNYLFADIDNLADLFKLKNTIKLCREL